MNYAVILSGGVGSRMQNANLPKQYIEINGKPILMFPLETFAACQDIHHIVIVANPEWQEQIAQWVKDFNISKPVTFAPNGENRQDSIRNGLRACAKIQEPTDQDKVLVHDAVRPLVDQRIIEDCISSLDTNLCCLTAVPDHDTTYITNDGITVADLIDRDKLRMGQTPEGFRLKTYWQLNEAASPQQLAATRGACEMMFVNGYPVQIVEGSPLNFKLTRPDDLTQFRALIAWKEESK